MTARWLLLLLMGIGFLPTAPVHAQEVCAARAEIIARLESNYGERAHALGLSGNGGLVELWVSKDSWTLIVTRPDGMSCLVAAGEGWQYLRTRFPGPRREG